ncbi:MAG: hypothetical protein WAW37_06280 [Syntrophobacteraceae bacterium]
MSQNPSGNGPVLRGAIIGFGNAAVNAGSHLAEAMRRAKPIRQACRSYREARCPMPVGDLP